MECIGLFISARGQDALLGLPLFLWAQGTGLRMAPIFKPYQYIIYNIAFRLYIIVKYNVYNI